MKSVHSGFETKSMTTASNRELYTHWKIWDRFSSHIHVVHTKQKKTWIGNRCENLRHASNRVWRASGVQYCAQFPSDYDCLVWFDLISLIFADAIRHLWFTETESQYLMFTDLQFSLDLHLLWMHSRRRRGQFMAHFGHSMAQKIWAVSSMNEKDQPSTSHWDWIFFQQDSERKNGIYVRNSRLNCDWKNGETPWKKPFILQFYLRWIFFLLWAIPIEKLYGC